MAATHVTALELIIYAVASFFTAIISGIAGGGAGFINAPLLIFLGLSPAQAVATGKLTGLSVAVSSLSGFRGVDNNQSKKRILVIVGIALVVGLLSPFVIKNLDNTLYRRILGVLMLAMIPVLLIKKPGKSTKETGLKLQALGYLLLVPALLLQGIFGAGMGTLVNIVLMLCMGMSALESSIAKRFSQVILNVVIIFGVLLSHLIVWPVAMVGVVSSAFGGHIGAHLAVKHGNTIVVTMLVALTLVSALYLLFSS